MGAYDNPLRERDNQIQLWVPNSCENIFLKTMIFMKTRYGERHIVDFHKALLKLTEC